MLDFSLPITNIHKKGDTEIIDYNSVDFRKFWAGASKNILHECESRIIREILPPISNWFIDIGCGFGRLIPSYFSAGKRIVLVDYALNHLQMASQIYSNKNIYFIAADVYNLPFRNNVFSGGICVRLFHHVNLPEQFMYKFSRIFHNKANVILTYINKRSLFRIFKYGFRSFQKNHGQTSRMVFSTHPKYYSDLIQISDFIIESIRGTGFLHQIVNTFGMLEQIIDNRAYLMNLFALAERIADRILGNSSLALIQFALLLKNNGKKEHSLNIEKSQKLEDILACPNCSKTNLEEKENCITCLDCQRIFTKHGKIYDFRV